ncbi:MAG TPA: DUF5665 domain-containing protein [Candidatus Saccharimonadales bacterium]
MVTQRNKKSPQLEAGPATDVLEDLFNDFNRDRKQIYNLNFVRGVFFGLGSALGGTLIIALLVWVLSLLSGTWLDPLVQAIKQAAR